MPYDIGVKQFCREVTEAIKGLYTIHGADTDRLSITPIERTTASAVIYSRHHRQIWLVGDCHCTVNGIYHDNPKPTENFIASKRADFIAYMLSKCKNEDDIRAAIKQLQTCDAGRKHIMPELIASCLRQNKDYAVIDGFDIPMDKVKVIDIGKERAEIILASDGYPFIKSTLQQSEEALSKLIANDPLLINTYKATKGVMTGSTSFDDRSYIRFYD